MLWGSIPLHYSFPESSNIRPAQGLPSIGVETRSYDRCIYLEEIKELQIQYAKCGNPPRRCLGSRFHELSQSPQLDHMTNKVKLFPGCLHIVSYGILAMIVDQPIRQRHFVNFVFVSPFSLHLESLFFLHQPSQIGRSDRLDDVYDPKFLPESECDKQALCQNGFPDFLRAVLLPIRILGMVTIGTSVLWLG